jgi:hypothetical protein
MNQDEMIMKGKTGRNSMIASIVSSIMIVGIFLVLALLKNSGRQIPLYTDVDIMAGMIFVFIMSMIVSASIWPGIMDKK